MFGCGVGELHGMYLDEKKLKSICLVNLQIYISIT